jgi:hypothetical protein
MNITLSETLIASLLERTLSAPSVEAAKSGVDALTDLIGEKVFIRTVTYHYTGQVVAVDAGMITLRDAAWIADSGRWATALKTGELSEVEPYLPGQLVYVGRGAIVDVTAWTHGLPTVQK